MAMKIEDILAASDPSQQIALAEAEKAAFEIVDWPNGLPGDIGVTPSWASSWRGSKIGGKLVPAPISIFPRLRPRPLRTEHENSALACG
jgi:hypothetical protein